MSEIVKPMSDADALDVAMKLLTVEKEQRDKYAAEIARLTAALENARKDALEEAIVAINKCKADLQDESYVAKNMHAAKIIAAIRSLTPPTEKAT